ncbi:P-loop NTPase fold protein [Thalassotalea piscium]
MAGFLAKKLVGASFDQIEGLFDDEPEDKTKYSKDLEKDVAKTVSSITTKAAEFALKEHINTKDSIEKFKVNLKDLVDYIAAETDYKLPLFILVDELDRCRPNYAIELLETIKHLFEVKGVYFIIATASHQLSHSINAVYGNNFESKRYLNRFFDQEYQLTEPKHYIYCSFLFDKEISDASKLKTVLPDNCYKKNDKEVNMNVIFIGLVAQFTKAGLRDIEQAIKLLQAINLTYKESFYSVLIIFLIFCKIRHPDIYPTICNLWGNKPWNEDLKQKIMTNFNQDIVFKHCLYSSSGYRDRKTEKIYILDLILDILGLDGQPMNEIINTHSESDISFIIASDYLENITPSHIIDFSFYPKVVNQVGQLM